MSCPEWTAAAAISAAAMTRSGFCVRPLLTRGSVAARAGVADRYQAKSRRRVAAAAEAVTCRRSGRFTPLDRLRPDDYGKRMTGTLGATRPPDTAGFPLLNPDMGSPLGTAAAV